MRRLELNLITTAYAANSESYSHGLRQLLGGARCTTSLVRPDGAFGAVRESVRPIHNIRWIVTTARRRHSVGKDPITLLIPRDESCLSLGVRVGIVHVEPSRIFEHLFYASTNALSLTKYRSGGQECPVGSGAFRRVVHPDASNRPTENYIGQIVPAQYRPNVFASPGLSKQYIPRRGGMRDDIPAWSVKPDGHGIKSIGGGDA